MKLVFDARPMANQFSGLARYTGSLLESLLSTATNDSLEFIVLLHSKYDWNVNFHFHKLATYARSGRCSIVFADAPPISLMQHLSVRSVVNKLRPDHYFYPHFDLPVGIDTKTTFVIHDLIPLIVPGYVQRLAWLKREYFRHMVKYSVHRSDRCIAVSNTTRDDIVNVAGDQYAKKIEIAYEGPVLAQYKVSDPTETATLVKGPFLLYVGDRRPHKNLPRVLDLYIRLRDDHGYPGNLVLVGSTQNYGIDFDHLVKGRPDVHVLGNVTDAQLTSLYKKTDSLVFLSEYEGFGLPVVEAARFGRKMILSDGGSLAEIAPHGAYIIPRSLPIDEIASKVASYLREPLVVDYSAYNRSFSWEIASRLIFPFAYE